MFKKLIAPLIMGSLLIWLLFFRQLEQPLPEMHWQQFLGLGTLIEITVRSPDAELATNAVKAVEKQLETVNADWHAWDNSRLAEINQQMQASGQAVIPVDMQPRIHRAQALSQASGGRFDPAIGHLVKLWGFHDDTLELTTPPVPEVTMRWRLNHLPFPEWQWAGDTLIGNQQGWLDFGAFAKGSAVALAVTALRDAGVENALINAGGDLAAIGTAKDQDGERPWLIGIRNPRRMDSSEPTMLAKLQIRSGEAMFTSGDYERYFVEDGVRYHHVLSPFTAYPTTKVASVTVLANDAELADAAATALMVAGPGAWPAVAASMQLSHVLLYTEDGQAEISASMRERVDFVLKPKSIKIMAIE